MYVRQLGEVDGPPLEEEVEWPGLVAALQASAQEVPPSPPPPPPIVTMSAMSVIVKSRAMKIMILEIVIGLFKFYVTFMF